jgi:hypothetical protein
MGLTFIACNGDDDGPCRPLGRYVAGKGLDGSDYEPCCAGLNEIFTQSASTDASGAAVCVQIPARTYSCIQGSCGDGTCEEPERSCGCPEDCGGPPFENLP